MPAATAFSTIFNLRDVGGLATVDGRAVRRRRLYRSDSPHRVAAEREAFLALGIRTVVDLRRPHEVARDGRVPDYDGLAYRHIHPEHRDWSEHPYDQRDSLGRYLADRYLDLSETGTHGISTALGIIADPDNAPVLVHCVAGKDRTGVVCALALSLLGVDDETIAADYALSTAASERFTAWLRAQTPASDPPPLPFLSSPAEAMLLFLAGLRERHGSIEGYVRHAGLTDDQAGALRDHLLD